MEDNYRISMNAKHHRIMLKNHHKKKNTVVVNYVYDQNKFKKEKNHETFYALVDTWVTTLSMARKLLMLLV